jgi:hypothetical protein
MRIASIAALTVGLAVAVAPAAAQASSTPRPSHSHCATHGQFKRVKHGMTVHRVAHILGHKGKIEVKSVGSGYGDEDRSYATCSEFSDVVVGFSKNPGGTWRESAKSGVFTS